MSSILTSVSILTLRKVLKNSLSCVTGWALVILDYGMSVISNYKSPHPIVKILTLAYPYNSKFSLLYSTCVLFDLSFV